MKFPPHTLHKGFKVPYPESVTLSESQTLLQFLEGHEAAVLLGGKPVKWFKRTQTWALIEAAVNPPLRKFLIKLFNIPATVPLESKCYPKFSLTHRVDPVDQTAHVIGPNLEKLLYRYTECDPLEVPEYLEEFFSAHHAYNASVKQAEESKDKAGAIVQLKKLYGKNTMILESLSKYKFARKGSLLAAVNDDAGMTFLYNTSGSIDHLIDDDFKFKSLENVFNKTKDLTNLATALEAIHTNCLSPSKSEAYTAWVIAFNEASPEEQTRVLDQICPPDYLRTFVYMQCKVEGTIPTSIEYKIPRFIAPTPQHRYYDIYSPIPFNIVQGDIDRALIQFSIWLKPISENGRTYFTSALWASHLYPLTERNKDLHDWVNTHGSI